ncbi:NAD/NADP-dependent betaine aldehyde dehydrogenase [Streptomyces violarus]
MTSTHAFWLAGREATGEDTFDVTSPWDGRLVGKVSVPTDAQVEEAVAAAYAVRDEFAATPAHVRAAALDHVSRRLVERTEEIAQLISAENGKPLKWARGEVGRAVSVFRFAAEEARRFNGGEAQRLDTDLGGQGRLALTRRFPKGVVLGIAPFNFPLNLCAHKVAPAIAAGAPIILKPAPATPLSGLIIGDLLAETELPAGSWSILPVANDKMPALVQDERLPVISFTGSEKVGYAIMDSVPRKHCTLELGGNGAAVVLADWASDEDLDWAANRIATFSNYQGGQSCISVQRVVRSSVSRPLMCGSLPATTTTTSARAAARATASSPRSATTTSKTSGSSSATFTPSAETHTWRPVPRCFRRCPFPCGSRRNVSWTIQPPGWSAEARTKPSSATER